MKTTDKSPAQAKAAPKGVKPTSIIKAPKEPKKPKEPKPPKAPKDPNAPKKPKVAKDPDAPKGPKRVILGIHKNISPMLPTAKMDELKGTTGPKRICPEGVGIIYQRCIAPRAHMIVAEAIRLCQREGYKKVTREHGIQAIKSMRAHVAHPVVMC